MLGKISSRVPESVLKVHCDPTSKKKKQQKWAYGFSKNGHERGEFGMYKIIEDIDG